MNGTVLEQLSRKLVVWDYLSFCYPKLIDLYRNLTGSGLYLSDLGSYLSDLGWVGIDQISFGNRSIVVAAIR